MLASTEGNPLLLVESQPGPDRARTQISFLGHFLERAGGVKRWIWRRMSACDAQQIERSPDGRWCPEEEASVWQRLSFGYVDSLVEAGYVKPLQADELWDVARWDAAPVVCGRFQAELAASRDPRRAPQGRVWTAMWATHGLRFIYTGLLKLMDTGLILLGPVLLERVLHSLQEGGSRWVALGYALIMFVVSVVETLNNQHQMYHAMRIFLHLRTALIDMLYRKSLRVSVAARSSFGIGHVVNLQSNDAAKLWWLPPFLHVLWTGPLTIGVVMAMLVRLLGWVPSLAGLTVAAGLIPASGAIGRRLGRVRRALVSLTDARVRMTREVLGGIRAIKLYAWEEPYVERIRDLRDGELRQIKIAALLSAANSVLFLGGPILVSLASFTTFGLLGGSLKAEVAFPALALFNLLRHPLMMLPSQIVSLINAQVALKRVQAFMEAEEIDDGELRPAATPGNTAVCVKHGTFCWEAGSPATLQDVELEVAAGKLVMVVGEVGAGKSSLLSALLGEMHSEAASVSLAGSVAYCAQDPWIQNASLRDNILMGRPYELQAYNAVLEACALLPDLETLPTGDAAEIGEKGVNLSGGQRHRVALARAAYSRADVYLLDDPLSAVDAHVGRHLFTQTLTGLLGGFTRILVTHQLQYLPAADEVIVLSGGRITHRGTYDELLAANVQFAHFESVGCAATDGDDDLIDDVNPDSAAASLTASEAPTVNPSTVQHGAGGQAGDPEKREMSTTLHAMPLPPSPAGPGATPTASPGPPGSLRERPTSAGSDDSAYNPAVSARPQTLLRSDTLPDSRNSMDLGGLIRTPSLDGDEHSRLPHVAENGEGRRANGKLEGVDALGGDEEKKEALQGENRVEEEGDDMLGTLTPAPSLQTLVPAPSWESQLAGPNLGDAAWAPGSKTVNPGGPALVPVEEDDGETTGLATLNGGTGIGTGEDGVAQSSERERLLGRRFVRSDDPEEGGPRVDKPEGAAGGKAGKLMAVEERSTGHVERSMYMAYLSAWGPCFVLPMAVAGLVASERGCQVAQNWWLSVWATATSAAEAAGGLLNSHPYLAVFVAFGLSSLAIQACRLLAMVYGSLSAARRIHSELLSHVLRLPMSFFESQPLGRLLNRFSRDTEAVDMKVPDALGSFITSLVNVMFSLLVVIAVSPLALVAMVPVTAMYERVRRRYVATSRELKRLDSIALSPIFSNFNETLTGLVTVRAYRRQAAFQGVNQELLDASTRCQWPIPQLNRYLGVRLELLGSIIVLTAAVTAAVILPRSAALAGLAITASLNLTGVLNWLVRQSTELEVQMNGVERMRAYLGIPTEAPAVIPGHRPARDWPSRGEISVESLVVRYRADLPPVLFGLSLSVAAGEKVGIAGRTGCGKSTLMMALYRMLEAESGRIIVDGIDIASIGLFDLRSRLALVPQDPVLFRGSVRANLDPFDAAGGDAPIWEALDQAGLKPTIRALEGGLDADVEEGGGNLSTGQRQLLCMARALLRRTVILVLDEATSNVDGETDALIQATVRDAFASCTVLTVAHRLHTIADCNRIFVMEAGTAHEFDTPSNLLRDPRSAFFGLVAETERARQGLDSASRSSSAAALTPPSLL